MTEQSIEDSELRTIIHLLAPLIEDKITAGQIRSKAAEVLSLIHQREQEAELEAFKLGLLTGAMPEEIGKPVALDYIAERTQTEPDLQASLTKKGNEE